MIEVEAKVRVGNLEETKRKIELISKFVGVFKKVDYYYSLQKEGYPKKSLRIRKQGKEYVVNFRQRVSYVKGVHAKKETEFHVSDIKGFLRLIKDFGFEKWLKKVKISYVYRIDKNFHIEINKVKGLGNFLEVEYIAKPSEVKKARKRVVEVLESLGVNKEEIVEEGYTKMLLNKRK